MAHNQRATLNCRCEDCKNNVVEYLHDVEGISVTTKELAVTMTGPSSVFSNVFPNAVALSNGKEIDDNDNDNDDDFDDFDDFDDSIEME